MQTTDNNIQPGPIDPSQLAAHRYQCHHTFPDGARCGSPALRNETRCYYHHDTRTPAAHPRDRNARMNTFAFPFPDSRTAVQAALGDLMLRIGSNDIDPRRAGLLLYCLQLAQANLKATELAHQQAQQQSQQHKTNQLTEESPDFNQAPKSAPAFNQTPEIPAAFNQAPERAPVFNQAPEGAPGFSPVNDEPTARGFSPGSSNPFAATEVRTQASSFEDFAQKTGEGETTESNPADAVSNLSEVSTYTALQESPATCNSQPATRRISQATFAALLESLARHHGINVDDPIYANHNQDSPILAAAEADETEEKPTLLQLTTNNLQLTTPLVILNHSNVKQTNRTDHPRRLGLPRRDPRKRNRSGSQANLRQASGDVSQHPHSRQ